MQRKSSRVIGRSSGRRQHLGIGHQPVASRGSPRPLAAAGPLGSSRPCVSRLDPESWAKNVANAASVVIQTPPTRRACSRMPRRPLLRQRCRVAVCAGFPLRRAGNRAAAALKVIRSPFKKFILRDLVVIGWRLLGFERGYHLFLGSKPKSPRKSPRSSPLQTRPGEI